MKKLIFTGITIIACTVLCTAVWPRNAGVEDLPAEPNKNAAIGEIEARLKEMPKNLLSVDTPAPEAEVVTESETQKTDTTAEGKTKLVLHTEAAPRAVSKSAPASPEPKPGTIVVIDGVKSMWIPGFGWVKDEGGGSVCISVDGEGDINKQVGVMGGGTMVGNPGDELAGNKVGIMGGGIVAEDMYENGHKIGIMGGDESAPCETTAPPAEQLDLTGDVIYIEFQPTPTKDSTPPPYKHGEVPSNP